MSRMLKNTMLVVAGAAGAAAAAHVITGGKSTEVVMDAINDKLHKGASVVETVTDVAEDLGDVASDIADGVTI